MALFFPSFIGPAIKKKNFCSSTNGQAIKGAHLFKVSI